MPLTGKSAEAKVVIMSNVEFCCKEDDINCFNKLVSYTDDSRVSIEILEFDGAGTEIARTDKIEFTLSVPNYNGRNTVTFSR